MARQGWGRRTPVSGSDSGDQVSVNAWNADNKTEGLFGFTGKTIASAASVTIPPFSSTVADQPSSLTILSGSTSIDTIATTNTAIYDLLYVITSGSVTLNDTSTNSGNIHLLGNANFDLSTTVPTILIRVGTAWYEYGGSPVTPSSITFAKIQDIASMKVIGRTAASTGITSEVTILDSDTMTGASATTLATSESIKAYVDNTTTAQDLDITDGTTAGSIDLDSESLTFTSGEGIDATVSGQTLTIAGEDATTSNKGVASFAATEFSVSSGAVSVGAIAEAKVTGLTTALGGKSPTAGNGSLVTVGALDSGSITSGFGNIDNGSSTITTSAVTATTFTGSLSGNVTGNASGTAATVTGAAQSAITSVGDLTTLTVDNLTINANKIESINAGGAIELAPKTTGVVTVIGNTNDGAITLNCTANTHGQTIKSQPHSATATNTMLLPLGANSTLVSLVSTDTLENKTLTAPVVNVGSDATGDIYYRNASGVFTRLAKPGTPAGEVLTFAASATIPSWAAAAGGGATILHDYTIQASTYTGGAPSGTTRSVFIRTIDANNEGIFVKIKKNGTAGVEVQIA